MVPAPLVRAPGRANRSLIPAPRTWGVACMCLHAWSPAVHCADSHSSRSLRHSWEPGPPGSASSAPQYTSGLLDHGIPNRSGLEDGTIDLYIKKDTKEPCEKYRPTIRLPGSPLVLHRVIDRRRLPQAAAADSRPASVAGQPGAGDTG